MTSRVRHPARVNTFIVVPRVIRRYLIQLVYESMGAYASGCSRGIQSGTDIAFLIASYVCHSKAMGPTLQIDGTPT